MNNTPTQGQRGRKRKADKQQPPQQTGYHQNRGYQQPQNENQRRQQATINTLSLIQENAFPQTPQAGQSLTAGLSVGDIGSGMAPGISIDDEFADNLVDDLDRLTPRDLAAARYTRNHEMLDIIFDARRVDKIQPPSSYYSTLKKQDLESRISKFQTEISEMNTSHSKRMRPSSQIYEEEVSAAKQSKEGVEEGWEKSPSSGKILGVCLIRASTPPEVREFLDKQKESLSKNAKPKDSDEVLKGESEEERSRKEMEMIDKINGENGVGIPSRTNDDPNNEQNDNNQDHQNGTNQEPSNGQDQDQVMNHDQNEASSFDELLAASGLSSDAFTNMDSPSQQMDFNSQDGGTPQN